MDRNTLTGILLLGAMLFGYTYLNRPSEEEIQAQQRAAAAQQQEAALDDTINENLASAPTEVQVTDSTPSTEELINEFGVFHQAISGTKTSPTIENDELLVTFSSKGAKIESVQLKNQKKYDGSPLILFHEGDSKFDFLFSSNNRVVSTADLYFDHTVTKGADNSQEIRFRIPVSESNDAIDFVYTIQPKTFDVGFKLEGDGLAHVLPPNATSLTMNWEVSLPQIEKGRGFEQNYSALNYKLTAENEVENLSESDSEQEAIKSHVKWFAFKDQFFSSIFLASDESAFLSGNLSTEFFEEGDYLKKMTANMLIPFAPGKTKAIEGRFVFIPNKIELLEAYKGENFDQLVPLGWGILGWFNKWVVIKIFNFLEQYISNYGIIILILTIIIKLIVFPFTYKSYLSAAKMRLLKPQIEEINERIPETKPMDRQKATMALYSKVGVSPMGGCIPLLFQFPILFAMFKFFPSSFELRQQPFLWADDLSSYDSIISWSPALPLIGDHLSLFCILMTVTNIIYTVINSNQMSGGAGNMAAMKYMMYFMPVVFFFVLNDYASGLSYYYFVSTLITILQTVLMRRLIDEDKLMMQLEANKKKPRKKSGFQSRLEEMQRKQLEAQRKNNSKKKK